VAEGEGVVGWVGAEDVAEGGVGGVVWSGEGQVAAEEKEDRAKGNEEVERCVEGSLGGV
jgi:hypothetical protein